MYYNTLHRTALRALHALHTLLGIEEYTKALAIYYRESNTMGEVVEEVSKETMA